MKRNFNAEQIKWASQHDWFAYATATMIFCWDQIAGQDATVKIHTDFSELKDWAGY